MPRVRSFFRFLADRPHFSVRAHIPHHTYHTRYTIPPNTTSMGPFRFLSTALLLIQATAFAPILPNSRKKTSSSLIVRFGAKDGDLFASISKLAAALKDPKRALYQAIAGDYDEEAVKNKVEALIADEAVLMFSQTT
jgi:hypothetical protein